MKRCVWLLYLLFGGSILSLKAQDQVNFTQFYLNPYLINPSFAGIDGQSSFSVIYRRQWINIDGGPSIANVSLHTPVNTKTSIGMSITNDKKGLLNNTGLLLTLAYNLPVADHSYLRFGLSAGGNWNTVDFEKFESSTDPAVANLLDKNASVAGNAGVSFHHKLFHLGITMPSIFSPSYVSENAFTITEVKPFQSLLIHASNRFYFNDNKNVFEPYAIYRMNTGLPSQFELAGIVHLNHTIWAGGSFKQDFGISALGGIKLRHMFAIGGAYTLKNSGENELNSATFEVSINYLFGKHKKGTHTYSFVNTTKEKEKKPVHHPSASEALAAKHKQEEAAQKKQQEAQAKAEADRKKREQEALAKAEAERKAAEARQKPPVKQDPVVVTPKPEKRDTVVAHRPRFSQEMIDGPKPKVEEHTLEHEQERLQRLSEHADDPTAHHGDAPDAHPHAERHEFVKRGNHKDELDVADYVVGGVFRSAENAKRFSQGLSNMGFKADYGHLTEKNLWYVYLTQTDDINVARAERDKYRKMKLFRDAWLLTVHH